MSSVTGQNTFSAQGLGMAVGFSLLGLIPGVNYILLAYTAFSLCMAIANGQGEMAMLGLVCGLVGGFFASGVVSAISNLSSSSSVSQGLPAFESEEEQYANLPEGCKSFESKNPDFVRQNGRGVLHIFGSMGSKDYPEQGIYSDVNSPGSNLKMRFLAGINRMKGSETVYASSEDKLKQYLATRNSENKIDVVIYHGHGNNGHAMIFTSDGGVDEFSFNDPSLGLSKHLSQHPTFIFDACKMANEPLDIKNISATYNATVIGNVGDVSSSDKDFEGNIWTNSLWIQCAP